MRTNVPRALLALVLAVAGVALAVTPAGAGSAPARQTAAAAPVLKYATHPPSTRVGPYRLQFAHSGMCLTIPAGSIAVERAQLEQRPCSTTLNSQLWQLEVASSGVEFRLRSPWSGMCANVSGGSYVAGARIIQYRCGTAANEFFKQTYQVNDDGTVTPPGADFWYTPGATSNFAFYVSGGSTAAGAKVFLYNRAGVRYEYIRYF